MDSQEIKPNRLWRIKYRDEQNRRCTGWMATDSRAIIEMVGKNSDTVTEVNPVTGEPVEPDSKLPT